MANESFGNIILKLLVDNNSYKEGLATALQLTQIAATQIKDLMSLKISAPDLKALDAALAAGEARMKDFIKLEAEVELNLPTVPPEVPKSHEEHNKKLGEGEKALRQFFREQRLQDRVMSEGRQSVLALTSALGFLSVGNTDATSTSKVLQEGMLAGIGTANGLEFALFGLGQVGGKLPGMFGAIATSAGALAGPISIAVGVGAALLTFLDSANAKSKKLAEEGLQAYLGRIREAGGGNLSFLESIERSLEAQSASLEKLKKVSETTTFGGLDPKSAETTIDLLRQQTQAVGDVSAQVARAGVVQNLNEQDEKHKKIIEELKEEIEKQKVLNEAIKRANDDIKANGDEYRRMKVEIEELTAQIEAENLSEEKRRALIDERAVKQERIHQLTLSSFDLAREEISLLEQRKALGEATTQQLIEQIDKALQSNLTEKQRLELESQRHSLVIAAADEEIAVQQSLRELGRATTADVVRALEAKKAKVKTAAEELAIEQQIRAELEKEINLEEQRNAKRRAELKATQDAYTRLQNITVELTTNAIQNEFDQRLAREELRHAKVMSDIDEAAGHGLAMEDVKEARDAANAENKRQRDLIERDRLLAKHELELFLLGDTAAAEFQRIHDTYAEQERLARQIYTDKDQLDAVLTQLRKNRDRDVADAELRNAQRVFGAAQSLVSNIVSIARAIEEPAEGFLRNLEKALQVAQAIAAVMQAVNIISTIFGFSRGGPLPAARIAYAASGMQIPGGSYVVKKSAVDQNRPLLEALGGREVTGGIPGKDSVAARTEGEGIVMMMPGEMIVEPKFAPIAKAVNEGRVRMLAGGGPVVQDWMGDIVSVVRQYVQVNPSFSVVPLPAKLVEQLKAEVSLNGGFNKETMDALIDEVRNLRNEVGEMKTEIRSQTASIDDQTTAVRDLQSVQAVIDREELRRGMKDIETFEGNKTL